MKKRHLLMAGLAAGTVFFAAQSIKADACTEIYVGKEVSATGRTYYGRTEDYSADYCKIFDVKEAGAIRADSVWTDAQGMTYQWGSEDSYRYTSVRDSNAYWDGQSNTCYEAQGTNQYGVTISATESLYENEAVLDEDPFNDSEEIGQQGIGEQSLTTIVLGQAKTAREGIQIIARAVDTHGASEASGIIVGDGNETWYMEIVSGYQYAAYLLPDDVVFINPNVTIMKNVDTADTAHFIVSADLIDTAKAAGTYTDIHGKKMDEADNTTIDLNLSYSDLNSSNRMKVGMDFLNSDLGVTTDNSSFVFTFAPKKKLTFEDIKAFFRLPYIARKGTTEGTIFEFCNSAADAAVAADKKIVEWRTMASPIYSIFVPYYPMAIDSTPERLRVDSVEYVDGSSYWAFNEATKLGFLFPDTKGKTIIEEFAKTEKNIAATFEQKKNIEDATALADTLSKEAYEKAIAVVADNYLPDVKVPAGSTVKIESITKIEDKAVLAKLGLDKLEKTLAADLAKATVGKGKGRIIMDTARLFDIKATGSGKVILAVGQEYAGKIAIVGHFHDGKWTAQQLKIDENGNVEAVFGSFSPVFVAATNLSEATTLSIEAEPAPTVSASDKTEGKTTKTVTKVTGGKSPKTDVNDYLYILLIAVMTAACGALVYRKKENV